MTVMMPREKWTDERLDDLNEKVDKGFAETKAEMREGFGRVDTALRELRGDMNAGFDKVDARFERVDARFDKVDERFERVDARFDKIDERFESLYKVLIGGAVGIIAALIGVNAF